MSKGLKIILAGVLAVIVFHIIRKVNRIEKKVGDLADGLKNKPEEKPEGPVYDVTPEASTPSQAALAKVQNPESNQNGSESRMDSDSTPLSDKTPEKTAISVSNPILNSDSACQIQITPDFRMVKVRDSEYTVSPTQGRVIHRLIENLKEGISKVHQDTLLEDLGVYSKKMRDVFKKSPLWKSLVVQMGKGFYGLNL